MAKVNNVQKAKSNLEKHKNDLLIHLSNELKTVEYLKKELGVIINIFEDAKKTIVEDLKLEEAEAK